MKWCKCLSCINPEVEDITTLDFSCSSLKEVPALVFNFERTLQNLYLDCNKIVELPRTLFQCEEIRYLVLCDNEVETIPPLVEKLKNLEVLMLNRNCLAYESIPANIHRCHRLKVLHLSSNNLTRVPNSVTRLICLKELYLNNCDIEYLPANFGRLNNLHILELRENYLSSLPKSLKQLSDLTRLDISSNMFRTFPTVVGTMLSVSELWINDNFMFEIPDCIGNLTKLTHFDASCNRLKMLSKNIGLCVKLNLLLLSMNDLKELPETIGRLIVLHTLKVDHNLLETLPDSIGCLQDLEELDVQFNHLQSFPASIGRLRKLYSLVSAQNFISHLPVEIGSCSSLSVLSLHYNSIEYLPEEIGHLQNLTSISLINNKLHFLPITILSLKKLKALWLSHNQIQPLISLQAEPLENGQMVLTCVFLPQLEVSLEIQSHVNITPTGRRIEFVESNCMTDIPAKFSRIPTPHPKAFVKYQRTLDNILKRSQDMVSHNAGADIVHIREANIIPMKNCNTANNDNDIQSEVKIDESLKKIDYSLQNDVGNGDPSDKSMSVEGELTEIHTHPILSDDNRSTSFVCDLTDSKSSSQSNSTELTRPSHSCAKPKQPPPYHIAATYSKGAHIFLNSVRNEQEAEPKHFTQDQPLNILNPQPKHARCIPQIQHTLRCTDFIELQEKLDYNLMETIIITTARLLRISPNVHQYRTLVKKWIEILRDDYEELDGCNLLDLKLYVLRITEYLLSNQDYTHLHQSHITIITEFLQTQLISFVRDSMKIKVKDSLQIETKLIFIEVIAVLLEINCKTPHFQDIVDLLVEEIHYPKNVKNFCVTECDTRVSLIMSKVGLINAVLFLITADITNNQSQRIFDKIIKIREQIEPSLVHSSFNLENENESKFHTNWVFGAHRNRKIVKVEMTPCCYVLGFSVNQTTEGVFVADVDKNGNAFQKLFTGDKILMLDDRDISKMDPSEALKAVQIWGPETETFLISRN